jgi:hypothetical protein
MQKLGVLLLLAAAGAASVSCAGASAPPKLVLPFEPDRVAAPGEEHVWTFDWTAPAPGTGSVAPAEQQARVFEAVLGRWGVEPDRRAPSSPNVFRQDGHYGPRDAPRVIVSDIAFAELTARVKCRPESFDATDACGVMFEVEDSDDYLLARAEATAGGGVVRLVHVQDGVEYEVASAPADVLPRVWHELTVKRHGARLEVAFDGTRVLDAHHDDGVASGRVGLWTKGGSVVSFDDFIVREDAAD